MDGRSTNGRPKSKSKTESSPSSSKDISPTAGGLGRRSTGLKAKISATSHKKQLKLMAFQLPDSDDFTRANPKRGAAESKSKKITPPSRRSVGNDKSSSKEDDDEEKEDDDMNVDDDSPPKKKKIFTKRGVKGENDAKKKAAAANAKKTKFFYEEDEDFDENEEFFDDMVECTDEESDVSPEPSDGEDENEDVDASAHVNFKDEEWFDKVTKTCQVCKESYKTCMDASNCVTRNHKRRRCYLCYNYYRNTSTLFRHFETNHCVSNVNCRNGQLLCPFCSRSFPFENTSCHVINAHIGPREAVQKGIKGKEGKDGRGKKTKQKG